MPEQPPQPTFDPAAAFAKLSELCRLLYPGVDEIRLWMGQRGECVGKLKVPGVTVVPPAARPEIHMTPRMKKVVKELADAEYPMTKAQLFRAFNYEKIGGSLLTDIDRLLEAGVIFPNGEWLTDDVTKFDGMT